MIDEGQGHERFYCRYRTTAKHYYCYQIENPKWAFGWHIFIWPRPFLKFKVKGLACRWRSKYDIIPSHNAGTTIPNCPTDKFSVFVIFTNVRNWDTGINTMKVAKLFQRLFIFILTFDQSHEISYYFSEHCRYLICHLNVITDKCKVRMWVMKS